MASSSDSYDFIFLGAGCASLSILSRLIDSGKFKNKKILLVDKESKTKNDRTWCFWEERPGFFQNIVFKEWKALDFISQHLFISLDINPYSYKMIRGIDFYNYCFEKISKQPNIVIEKSNISFQDNEPSIALNGNPLNCKSAIVFNSIYIPKPRVKSYHYLKQHFKGFVVESSSPIFDTTKATLMDFRVDQSQGTTFVYMLPLTRNRALVEYTQFSASTLPSAEYDSFLDSYLSKVIGLETYKIIEEEIGVIPMISQPFSNYNNGMYQIGTAGGQTKASTGYTFNFIQKQADKILARLIEGKTPLSTNAGAKRFDFYDNTLLHILAGKKLRGKEIFERLFSENKASSVFKFLDNETTLKEELRIINSLPKTVFLKAGFKEFVKLLT